MMQQWELGNVKKAKNSSPVCCFKCAHTHTHTQLCVLKNNEGVGVGYVSALSSSHRYVIVLCYRGYNKRNGMGPPSCPTNLRQRG